MVRRHNKIYLFESNSSFCSSVSFVSLPVSLPASASESELINQNSLNSLEDLLFLFKLSSSSISACKD